MPKNPQEAQEIQRKIEEYATFVKNVLQPDLHVAAKAVTETQQEIRDYRELQTQLQELLSPIDTSCMRFLEPMVDLGHGKVRCRASVDDASTIFVNVGMGFHAELNIPEARAFCSKRMNFLEDQVLLPRVSRSKQIEQHLLSSGAILDQLSHELKKTHIN